MHIAFRTLSLRFTHRFLASTNIGPCPILSYLKLFANSGADLFGLGITGKFSLLLSSSRSDCKCPRFFPAVTLLNLISEFATRSWKSHRLLCLDAPLLILNINQELLIAYYLKIRSSYTTFYFTYLFYIGHAACLLNLLPPCFYCKL